MRINSISIGFNEIPNNISILLYAQGCKHRCEGCHNYHLWGFDGGVYYDDDGIRKVLNDHKQLCSWICWLGGDATFQPDRLMEINSIGIDLGYKIALYTGNLFETLDVSLTDQLDMVVDGKWDSALGGIDSPSTNQKIYIKHERDGWVC